MVHGREAAEQAQQAAFAMFKNKGSAQNAPQHESSTNVILNILVESGLCSSKSDARRQIQGSAIKVDYGSGKESIQTIDAVMTDSGVLWRGKKALYSSDFISIEKEHLGMSDLCSKME